MAELVPDAKLLLRDDLSKEYYTVLGVVSGYGGWLRFRRWPARCGRTALAAVGSCSRVPRGPGTR
jgi:hypothetical protein